MESSPLRFLDNDVSLMLCEQVRLSKEGEARKFHDDLYYNGEKMNKVSHELIIRILSSICSINASRIAPCMPFIVHQYYITAAMIKSQDRAMRVAPRNSVEYWQEYKNQMNRRQYPRCRSTGGLMRPRAEAGSSPRTRVRGMSQSDPVSAADG